MLRDKRILKTREECRRAFIKRRCHKHKYLTFEEYEAHFSNPIISFVDIGKITNLPKHLVTRMYQRYFAPFVENLFKGGNGRRELRTSWKNAQPLPNIRVEEFAKLAEERCPGIGVVALSNKEHKGLSIRTTCALFKMVGKKCMLLSPGLIIPSRHNRARVLSTSILKANLAYVDFVVLFVSFAGEIEVFIIPSKDIIEKDQYFRSRSYAYDQNRLAKAIYVAYDLNKDNPKYHMWQYRDAWHLVKPI